MGSALQIHDCLLNHLFKHRSKKISKLRVTDHCAGKSSVTGEFLTQRAGNAENVSIWWRNHIQLCSIIFQMGFITMMWNTLNALINAPNDRPAACKSQSIFRSILNTQTPRQNGVQITSVLFKGIFLTGEFPVQSPVRRSFDVFFYLRLN